MSSLKFYKNVNIAPYTTFKIGGPAKYFFIARSLEQLQAALIWAQERKIKYFILGGGSNVLISDQGFRGLVIQNQNSKIKIQNYKSKVKMIYADAGVTLGRLVNVVTQRGLTGLEWAAGIPGTLGGAIHGNAGWPSNKKNISAVVRSVRVLELGPKLKIKNYNHRACQFAYRHSVFKNRTDLVILSARLKLKRGDSKAIKKEIAQIIETRGHKIPSGFSAGCVFKNQLWTKKYYYLLKQYPELKLVTKNGFIPAAWLIEKCGLKGKKLGQAQISPGHANFIINLGQAKAKDVQRLINLIKRTVKNKFKINLQEEIEII